MNITPKIVIECVVMLHKYGDYFSPFDICGMDMTDGKSNYL